MRYIIKNIRNILTKETFLAVVIVLCVFSSSWVLTFSYGLYQNYNIQKTEAKSEVLDVSPEIAKSKQVTKKDMVKYITSLSDNVGDNISIIALSASVKFYNDSDSEVFCTYRVGVHGGEICVANYLKENWEKNEILTSGRLFTDEEEKTGASVCLMQSEDNESFEELCKRSDMIELIGDNKIFYLGQEYKVVGTHKTGSACPIVPLKSLPDDYLFDAFSIRFISPVTSTQYSEITQVAKDVIPGIFIFPDLPFPDTETIYLYNNIMLISAAVAILTIINFAALYCFLLKKRTKQLASFYICGASKFKVFAIYLGECLTVSLPVFIIGMLSYIPVMKNVLSHIFPYLEGSYTPTIYLALFGIYAVLMVIIIGIMLLFILSKSAAKLWKGVS